MRTVASQATTIDPPRRSPALPVVQEPRSPETLSSREGIRSPPPSFVSRAPSAMGSVTVEPPTSSSVPLAVRSPEETALPYQPKPLLNQVGSHERERARQLTACECALVAGPDASHVTLARPTSFNVRAAVQKSRLLHYRAFQERPQVFRRYRQTACPGCVHAGTLGNDQVIYGFKLARGSVERRPVDFKRLLISISCIGHALRGITFNIISLGSSLSEPTATPFNTAGSCNLSVAVVPLAPPANDHERDGSD